LAETEKIHFCILSGKFGLVDWNEPLPWYDHLLTLDEVPQLVEVVARQLVEKGIDQLHFFAKSPSEDLQLWPYIKTIEQACAKAGVPLEGSTLVEPALSATPLSWKQIMELAAEAGQKLKLDRATGNAEFEKLLSFYPKDGMIYFQRALAYEAVGEYDRAKTDYEKSKQYFPLDRWKWEAQKALDALEQKMSAGGTIAEAKRRIKAMKKGDQSLQNEILAALSKVESDPKSAAVGLRSCLEVLVDRLYSSFGRKAEGDLADKIANLRSKSVPEMILDHMHTIRRIGNRGSHRRQPGEPPLKPADVYSSVTALVAVLEWLEERK
jgi:tetratricopeptide (TPR) repeat protein